MERSTVAVYEERGREWIARRQEAPRRAEAAALMDAVERFEPGGLRADLGCGGGRYLGDLGRPALGIDAARTMLAAAREAHPDALLVQADLEALPLRRGALAGAWAANSYLHVPSVRLPLALADLHRSLRPSSPIDVQVLHTPAEGALVDDDIGDRYFSSVPSTLLEDLLVGAGFREVRVHARAQGPGQDPRAVHATAVRARSLADTVGPGMRLLVCGLNPSEHAADAGVGFARPGNRFWPAALAAGLVSRGRDPRHALLAHGVGMTDLVKRATPRSADLSPDEYAAGMERLIRLVAWLRPRAVCFVGLEGYRAAIDRRARPGWQDTGIGETAVYVMPSTSGLNAHSRLDDLSEHLRVASQLC